MTKLGYRTIVVGVAMWLAIGMVAQGWGQTKGGRAISVLKPADGSSVGREIVVEGSASLAPGQFLWVLARRADFEPLWWPQRQAVVDPKTGSWRATAVFGGPQDIGWNFDVGVVAVDADGHAKLREYWVKAMASGDWRPIEIPTVITTALVKVKKVSH